MRTSDFAGLENFTLAVEAENRTISSVYCADLLSWAMARTPADSAWCTVMGNVNAVAVASLVDAAVIVLCEGAVLDDEAAAKAKDRGVNIVKTPLPAFEAAQLIHKCIQSK